MTTRTRREEIFALLQEATAPIPAKELARRFSVSRQVIVQDLAVMRAACPGIVSTSRGYLLHQETGCTREFKVRHGSDRMQEELYLIVDHGGHVKNISVSHRVYGRISVEMDIRSRRDVIELLEAFADSNSTLLGSTTSGYHYHLVEAPSAERLGLIEEKLAEAGFLAPLQPWEQESIDGNEELKKL